MWRDFAKSAQPGEIRKITLRTAWGHGFNDVPEDEGDLVTIAAKRCDHEGHSAEKAICDFLMENSATEFAGLNVKDAIACLSRNFRVDRSFQIFSGSFSIQYGPDNRGANIQLELQEDDVVGGMAFTVIVRGY
jgi:hypothetical protein